MKRARYPRGWRRISRRFRQEVAGDRCQRCGIKHLTIEAKGPDLRCAYPATRISYVYINSAHRNHDSGSSNFEDLIALCPRCHAYYDLDDAMKKKAIGLDHAGPHQLQLNL